MPPGHLIKLLTSNGEPWSFERQHFWDFEPPHCIHVVKKIPHGKVGLLFR